MPYVIARGITNIPIQVSKCRKNFPSRVESVPVPRQLFYYGTTTSLYPGYSGYRVPEPYTCTFPCLLGCLPGIEPLRFPSEKG
eukprot:3063611-Rhodomonas_salina.3